MQLILIFVLFSIGIFSEVAAQTNANGSADRPIELNLQFFSANKSIPQATLSEMEMAKLVEGDFILRKGYGWISDRIADLLNEDLRITHCGLILTKGYREPHVLHAMSNEKVNGVFVEPLKSFLKESQQGSLIAVRIKKPADKIESMILESKRMLAKKVPFDLAFNDADSSSFYCAELFAHVFKNTWKRDLLPEKFNLFGMNAIRMRNFLNPNEFEILFNQFEH
jgi:hypothetical protein